MSAMPELPRVERVDWFLQMFVALANEEPFEIPVTVATGGMLVTGDLVSGREYFEGFAEQFVGAIKETPDDVQTYWRDFLGGFATSVYGEPGEEEDDPEEEWDRDHPHYLHLRGARFFHPGGPALPGNSGVWWRARLESIEGFFLGSLRSSA